MLGMWVMQQRVRYAIAGAALASGFAMVELRWLHTSFAAAIAIFSVGLAALVGAGKLASP